MGRVSLIVLFCVCSVGLEAQIFTKGYPTQLTLDALEPGPDQTITGVGAPGGPGIYVELWRVPPGTAAAESVASVAVNLQGNFGFPGIDVAAGEHYFVTLSRSWQFNTVGDAEGWGETTTNDVSLEVSGGVLNVTIDGLDPHFFNSFDYDSDFYRVIEIRLRNPAVAAYVDPAFQDMGIYWGDFVSTVNLDFSGIPHEAASFETIMIPMNVGEVRIQPGPFTLEVDGLWATGLHDVLRIDPLDTVDPSAVGTVFEIDYIRIREDYRLEFDSFDDPMGIGMFSDMTSVVISDGILSYTADSAANPFLSFGFATGKFESQYFTNFVIGMDNPAGGQSSVSVLFNDDNSGISYIDPVNGTLQIAEFVSSVSGRQDVAMVMDEHTSPPGEWTADGRAPVKGLQVNLPVPPTAADEVRIDYLGFVPANPYGPSDPVFIPYPNNPPVAVIVSTPDPAVVTLEGNDPSAHVMCDASQSDDGDGGTQGLTYQWRAVSGPAGISIDQPDQTVTEVSFTEVGEYVVQLTVDDGEAVDSTEIALNVKNPTDTKKPKKDKKYKKDKKDKKCKKCKKDKKGKKCKKCKKDKKGKK